LVAGKFIINGLAVNFASAAGMNFADGLLTADRPPGDHALARSERRLGLRGNLLRRGTGASGDADGRARLQCDG
jgi:hypothetical protein